MGRCSPRRATSSSIRRRASARRSREVENNGIVFIDEMDKICAREGRGGADVSREGVQRDLLPLIEGTTVATKHGSGEDRPCAVHRLRRLPCRQALRSPAGTAGPAADPRGARLARRGGFPPHPHRDGSLPHQAICGADGDGRRRLWSSTPRPSTPSPTSRSR